MSSSTNFPLSALIPEIIGKKVYENGTLLDMDGGKSSCFAIPKWKYNVRQGNSRVECIILYQRESGSLA